MKTRAAACFVVGLEIDAVREKIKEERIAVKYFPAAVMEAHKQEALNGWLQNNGTTLSSSPKAHARRFLGHKTTHGHAGMFHNPEQKNASKMPYTFVEETKGWAKRSEPSTVIQQSFQILHDSVYLWR